MFIKKSKSCRLQVKYFVLVGAVCLFFFLYRLMHDRTAAEKSLSEASNEIAELKKMKKAAVDELLLLKQSTMIAPQQSIGQELDSEKCRDIFKARVRLLGLSLHVSLSNSNIYLALKNCAG